MKTTNFSWGDNLIDSRDIIARWEELTDEHNDLLASLESAGDDLEEFLKEYNAPNFHKNDEDEVTLSQLNDEVENAQNALSDFITSDDWDELKILNSVVEQGEDSPDWSYGEGLIHEDYFTEYTQDLINDCYEMPKEFESGKWPFNHMEMDWEGAAEEAKVDYMTIEADGITYYIRG